MLLIYNRGCILLCLPPLLLPRPPVLHGALSHQGGSPAQRRRACGEARGLDWTGALRMCRGPSSTPALAFVMDKPVA